jgi:hypothetical protein
MLPSNITHASSRAITRPPCSKCIHATSTAGEPRLGARDRSGGDGETRGLPIPWQEIRDLVCWVIRQACQHVGEPSLRINVIELACLDKGIDRGGSVAPGIGTREGPVFSSDGHAADRTLRCVV